MNRLFYTKNKGSFTVNRVQASYKVLQSIIFFKVNCESVLAKCLRKG